MKDLIIIGASAAGLSGAVYASRRRLNFQVISYDFGGEMALCGEVENWPGVVHTTGIELTEKFREQAKANSIEVEEGVRITKIIKNNGVFVIEGERGDEKIREKAQTVIIATGVHPRELDIPGEQELRAKGLSYCTVCDGPLFKDKIIATIGGGNSALESAIMMSEIAKKVYLINKNPEFKGDKVMIEKVTGPLADKNVEVVYNALTQKIKGDNFVSGLEYKDEETSAVKSLDLEGVFVHIGMVPNNEFVPGDLKLNEYGEVRVDKSCRTNIEGLFAAGDVTDIPYKQLAIAAGQGVTATLSAVDYLNKLTN